MPKFPLAKDGNIMPDLEAFDVATRLALETMPQADPHNYLAGKGWGAELAIRGDIMGRPKKSIPFDIPYRSHSDFELYGASVDENGCFSPYPPAFHELFGSQERYPVTKTKGIENLPEALMHDTAETIIYQDMTIKIPCLEILFLDKWLRRELTPRLIQGRPTIDAEILCMLYPLDREFLHELLEKHVIQPHLEKLPAKEDEYFQETLPLLQKRVTQNYELYKYADMDFDTASHFINGFLKSKNLPSIDVQLCFDNGGHITDEQENFLFQGLSQILSAKKTEIREHHGMLDRTLDWGQNPNFTSSGPSNYISISPKL